MSTPFSDITIYAPTKYAAGTSEWREEASLHNYICDLYCTKMNGYKPPGVTRITIQPAYHKEWERSWKMGSLVSIAPEFDYPHYLTLDKQSKYQYILDLVQGAVLQLCEEYKWDRNVFEQAYQQIIDNEFVYRLSYPSKMSRDKKKVAHIYVEKTETVTSAFMVLQVAGSTSTIKLFDKPNRWWYDSIYLWAKNSKWFDKDRFGMSYPRSKLDVWYFLINNQVTFSIDGNLKTDVRDYFEAMYL